MSSKARQRDGVRWTLPSSPAQHGRVPSVGWFHRREGTSLETTSAPTPATTALPRLLDGAGAAACWLQGAQETPERRSFSSPVAMHVATSLNSDQDQLDRLSSPFPCGVPGHVRAPAAAGRCELSHGHGPAASRSCWGCSPATSAPRDPHPASRGQVSRMPRLSRL